MRTSILCFLSAILGMGGAAAAEVAPPLPPIKSDLSGQLALPKIPGLPNIGWQLKVQPVTDASSDSLRVEATLKATGLDVQLEFTLPRGEKPGTWRIVQAKLAAASWWRLIAEQSGKKNMPDDFEFTGDLLVEGAGEWRGAEASGTLHVTLAAGTAGSAGQRWSATGLTLDAELQLKKSKPTLRTARVRVETIQILGLAATNLALDAEGAEGDAISVTRAEVAALGDRVTLTPFTIDPANPVLKTTADFSRLVLSDLALLAPQAVKEAKGRIAGRITVEWRPREASVKAEGGLTSLPGESAMLLLAPSPGLLTSRVPERLALLPILSIKNPAFDTLRRVELGEDSLTVDSLQVDLYRQNADGGRTAQIRVNARPLDDRDVKHITFTVNLSGPLDQVLRLGLGNKASVKLRADK